MDVSVRITSQTFYKFFVPGVPTQNLIKIAIALENASERHENHEADSKVFGGGGGGGGGVGCELRRCFCEPHHSCKLSYLQKEQSKCRGGFPGEGEMAVRINFQGDDDKRSGTAFDVILIRSQSCVLWYIYSIKFDSISTIKLRPLLLLKLKCGAQRRKNRS